MITLYLSGPLNLGRNGSQSIDPIPVGMTPTLADILSGYPGWSAAFGRSFNSPYNQVFDQYFDDGVLHVLLGTPVVVSLVGKGAFGYGGNVRGLSTDWRSSFSNLAIYRNPAAASKTAVELDPLNSPIVQGPQNNGGSTPVGAYGDPGYPDWVQYGATVIPPPGAVFMAPKIGITSPTDQEQWLTQFSVNIVDLDDIANAGGSVEFDPLLAYSSPRSISARVYPDRRNLSIAPTGQGLILAGADSSLGPDHLGTPSVVISPSSSVTFAVFEDQSLEVLPGEQYSYSFDYMTDADGAFFIDIIFTNELGETISEARSSYLPSTRPSEWERAALIVLVPEGAHRMTVGPVLNDTVTDSSITLTRILLEKSWEVGEYFDGSSGPDYSWTAGGTPFVSQSYYYKNKSIKDTILRRIIKDNSHMWVESVDVRYSDFDIYPAAITFGDTGAFYGFGFYGFGFYGTGG